MASVDKEAIKRHRSLSECCICLTAYTDPRLLPCFHTACLKCFQDLQSKNKSKPDDVLPCPLCRKKFTIPSEGMEGLQKNVFIESLMKITKAINTKDNSTPCDTCSMMEEETGDIKEATMKCLNCCENYCIRCSKMHKSQKLTNEHKMVEINSELKEEDIRNMFPVENCKMHFNQKLNYYCSDCKTTVCVSCFVENHKLHECKDVASVDKEFRQKVDKNCEKMIEYHYEMLSKKMDMERQKKEYLQNTLRTENAIRTKSQQLKSLIDQHTQAVLDELSLLTQEHKEKMEAEIEEIERKLTVIESFVTYCTELKSKGSASKICGCADNLITRAKELSKENEEYLSATSKAIELKFSATDQNVLLKNVSNVIGKLSESMKDVDRNAIVFARSDLYSISYDALKINLNRSEDVSYLQQMPFEMQEGATAALYCNSIFVIGVGDNYDEIWSFDATSSNWSKSVSMVKGRAGHSVAFVDHILYICGGYRANDYKILDDVEAYDAIADKWTSVGKLCYAVQNYGNCVPFKDSLYIFGGYDANNMATNNVQVYDTKTNTCSVLSKPMPIASSDLRAALWENSVILIGEDGSFIYNFDSEIWKVRDQFKISSFYDFGMTVHNGKIFVIGGIDKNMMNSISRDYVRYVPVKNFLSDEPIEWRHYAKLPGPLYVCAIEKIDCCK